MLVTLVTAKKNLQESFKASKLSEFLSSSDNDFQTGTVETVCTVPCSSKNVWSERQKIAQIVGEQATNCCRHHRGLVATKVLISNNCTSVWLTSVCTSAERGWLMTAVSQVARNNVWLYFPLQNNVCVLWVRYGKITSAKNVITFCRISHISCA